MIAAPPVQVSAIAENTDSIVLCVANKQPAVPPSLNTITLGCGGGWVGLGWAGIEMN